MQDELEKLEGAHFDAHLRKPISKTELIQTIANYIEHNKSEPQNELKTEPTVLEKEETVFSDIFCAEIQKEVLPLYDEAQVSNDLALIERFAQQLLESALSHEVVEIQSYAEALLLEIECFEIDKIMELMNSFDRRISSCIKID